MEPSSPSSSLADQFYRTQLVESKISWSLLIGIAVLFIITTLVVILTIRGHYLSFIQSPAIGTSFGFMCAFAHVYPFLAPMFFKNPNTPDIVINIFYAYQGFVPTNSQPNFWGPVAPQNNPLLALVDPSNWRDAVGTIVWFAESNRNLGYSDVVTWALGQGTNGASPPLLATPVQGGLGSLVNSLWTYGLPILNTVLMIGMAVAS